MCVAQANLTPRQLCAPVPLSQPYGAPQKVVVMNPQAGMPYGYGQPVVYGGQVRPPPMYGAYAGQPVVYGGGQQYNGGMSTGMAVGAGVVGGVLVGEMLANRHHHHGGYDGGCAYFATRSQFAHARLCVRKEGHHARPFLPPQCAHRPACAALLARRRRRPSSGRL